ncbi:MOSC domain-containing protein [Altererythrobacter salegens]|uniref:MOSC domain-containing protein n=1 Tax=Croceibacterium salegens TaxID=1737568 RepID=A0A6I4STK0_9SPHN|nr:MOSC domain-containing protein [Croceibacterium salegens]MXO58708.1 MOSC domain-containing protein [Croceibacterium salegens]
MAGRLAGIARHAAPKGPMETIDHVSVTSTEGVHGDFRGGLASTKTGHRRQVSLIEAESVAIAFAEAHATLDWSDCRRNLLVAGLRLPREEGAKIAIGGSLVIEVTAECDPCDRMDALKDGLRVAMTPDWRGGVLGRVIEDGEIAVGDEVRII